MVRLGEIVVIQDLKRRGLSVSAIARQTGLDRKTVRKYLDLGFETPVYGPRAPSTRMAERFGDYLRGRRDAFPGLSARRLHRELHDLGYEGAYSTLTEYLRIICPPRPQKFERRFETPAGRQAQVDFAEFKVEFLDEPGVTRKVWLFSLVLGHSRWLWGRFCPSQGLQTVLRGHIAAFEAMGGAPTEILYDRMKTAVIGEDADGVVTYNPSLVSLLGHYGSAPRACQPYRAKTKGKVERPFRYIRQDFFLGRTFRNLDDLNAQFDEWRTGIANPRVHATTGRVVMEHFAEEQATLTALPVIPYSAVLAIERRVTKDGMVSVAGNQYSVPAQTRRRTVEVQNHATHVRVFENGSLIAAHPVLEGRNQRRVDPSHRKAPPPARPKHKGPGALQRPLSFYDQVGQRLAEAVS